MQANDLTEAGIGRRAIAKARWRIVPLLGLGYLIACMDRSNISFAATQMNRDLHFNATVYGLGAGMFFISYGLCEIPSNLLLVRFGARRWLARIMVSWGVLAMGMALVRTPAQFYIMRFLLGFAEAGFFPGVIFTMAQWFPAAQRGRVFSQFYAAGPLTTIVMGLLSGALLKLDGVGGLRGWHWLFVGEGLPAVVMGVAIYLLLPDSPASVPWLDPAEKTWLSGALANDEARRRAAPRDGVLAALRNPLVVQLGVIGALGIGCFYAFNLSAPAVLMAGTGWGIVRVGYLTSLGGVLGMVSMLVTGPLTDRLGSRYGVVICAMLLMAAGAAIMAAAASPAMLIGGYLVFILGWFSVTNGLWLLGADVLPARSLAVGSAAINSMNFAGGFAGPYLWGWARDATGGYGLALGVMAVAMVCGAGMVAWLRVRAGFGVVVAAG